MGLFNFGDRALSCEKMKAFYSDHFVLPLPPGHRFPMSKYRLLREKVALCNDLELIEAHAATDAQILLAHDPRYLQRVMRGELTAKEQREIGFPWSQAMVERSRRSSGATIGACRTALKEGVSLNLAGGTHHAYRDHGSGFCVFNDAAIASRVIQKETKARVQVAIIDLDVHQGDGSAAILQNDPSIFTLSLHGERNYPFHKQLSDLDVALPDGCGDDDYLGQLAQALDELEQRFRADFLIYLAGADPHESDRLGRLKLTRSGMQARDEFVMNFAKGKGLPIAIAMAGGYSTEIQTIVDIHFQTVKIAAQMYSSTQPFCNRILSS